MEVAEETRQEFLRRATALGMTGDDAPGPVVPPEPMRAINADAREEGFLRTGALDAAEFMELCQRTALPQARPGAKRPTRVLDFGCGCGRLTRFVGMLDGVEAHGADVNADLVDWCRANLPQVHTVLNEVTPPLPFEDAGFDYVFSLSVFTHLAREQCELWLADLSRVLVPGGILAITTHGYQALDVIKASGVHHAMFNVDERSTLEIIERLPEERFIFLPYEPAVIDAAKAGPSYGNAFIDDSYPWESARDSGLELIEHRSGGLRGWQDTVVFRQT